MYSNLIIFEKFNKRRWMGIFKKFNERRWMGPVETRSETLPFQHSRIEAPQ
jgi:hypothetical protein